MNFLEALAASIVIGLASAAIWRAMAVDVVTKKVREWLWGEDAPDTTFRNWLKAWGKCPWCAGAWITVGITLLTDHLVEGGLPAPLLVMAAARYVTGWIGSQDEDYHEQTMKGEA